MNSMSWNKFKENKRWAKYEQPIYDRLIQRNRYSKYVDFEGWEGEEKMQLQALILADLGEIVQEVTGWEPEPVIELFEKFFESNFKVVRDRFRMRKPVVAFKWRGVDARNLQGYLPGNRPPSPRKIGAVVAALSKQHHLIEIRTYGNRHYYLANGYKQLMQDN